MIGMLDQGLAEMGTETKVKNYFKKWGFSGYETILGLQSSIY